MGSKDQRKLYTIVFNISHLEIFQLNYAITINLSMSSNGAVGCPEDMQVESTHENSLNILDKTSDKPKTLTNNITDISDQAPASSASPNSQANEGKLFSLKKWNAVAMWSWDVECDTCAICRVQVMDACLRCQAESKVDAKSLGAGASKDCVVVWGECNHSFHHCCMSLWIKQNNRCPLCQQEWTVQKLGK